MSDPVDAVAGRLAQRFGYGHAVLFGRARAGLAALLEIVGGPLIVPSNLCPAVVTAALAGGAAVRLASVSRETGLVSDATLAAAVAEGPARGVVMVAHLYGFVADYPETRRIAARKGWLVLENDSVAAKALAPESAFGDVFILSFGYAKTIDAGGGGALLTDDPALARALAVRAAAMPSLDAAAEAREAWLMALHRTLRQGAPGGAPGGAPMTAVIEALAPFEVREVRYGFPERLITPLARALDSLPTVIAERRAVAARWDAALARLGSALVASPLAQPVPWRVIRRVPGRRDAVVAALRAAGHDAGTNFPPLVEAFPTVLSGQRHDDASAWGREVLNLWVTPELDAARIADAVAVIARALEASPP